MLSMFNFHYKMTFLKINIFQFLCKIQSFDPNQNSCALGKIPGNNPDNKKTSHLNFQNEKQFIKKNVVNFRYHSSYSLY